MLNPSTSSANSYSSSFSEKRSHSESQELHQRSIAGRVDKNEIYPRQRFLSAITHN